MVLVMFRSRLRSDADLGELERMGQRMYAIASSMPGFVSYKDFSAADGESLTVVEFDSHEQLLAWRDHAEHREVQERGRRDFFESYHIVVCDPRRAYRFGRDEGRIELD